MGQWGHGPFDNDDAADWLHELAECPDDTALRQALEPVLLGASDAIDSRLAVAAAAVIAAPVRGVSESVPDEIHEWRRRTTGVDPALPSLARRALEALAERSELRQPARGTDPAAPQHWLLLVDALIDHL